MNLSVRLLTDCQCFYWLLASPSLVIFAKIFLLYIFIVIIIIITIIIIIIIIIIITIYSSVFNYYIYNWQTTHFW